MSTDLESQLRVLGGALDESAPPVTSREALDRVAHLDGAAPTTAAAEIYFSGVGLEHRAVVPLSRASRTRRRSSLLISAAAATIAVVGIASIAFINRAPDTPKETTPTSDSSPPFAVTRRSEITWYAPDNVGEVVTGTEIVCTAPADDNGCATIAGARAVTFRVDAGQVDVITEYGPAESTWWQELVRVGEPTDLGGRSGLAIADNYELVGFIASPGVRVTVVGEAGTNPADLVRTLVERRDAIYVPTAFGQAVATEAEFPRDAHVDGVNARFYAGYLDTSVSPPCIGGIGVPWNGNSCVEVEPGTINIAIASPSPTGTILIASVPLLASTVIVTGGDGEQRELPITDASSVGFKLVFADLDGLIPTELVAIGDAGGEIARAPITSTAGAPLGYLEVGFGN